MLWGTKSQDHVCKPELWKRKVNQHRNKPRSTDHPNTFPQDQAESWDTVVGEMLCVPLHSFLEMCGVTMLKDDNWYCEEKFHALVLFHLQVFVPREVFWRRPEQDAHLQLFLLQATDATRVSILAGAWRTEVAVSVLFYIFFMKKVQPFYFPIPCLHCLEWQDSNQQQKPLGKKEGKKKPTPLSAASSNISEYLLTLVVCEAVHDGVGVITTCTK